MIYMRKAPLCVIISILLLSCYPAAAAGSINFNEEIRQKDFIKNKIQELGPEVKEWPPYEWATWALEFINDWCYLFGNGPLSMLSGSFIIFALMWLPVRLVCIMEVLTGYSNAFEELLNGSIYKDIEERFGVLGAWFVTLVLICCIAPIFIILFPIENRIFALSAISDCLFYAWENCS